MTDDIEGYADDLDAALEDLMASIARIDKLKTPEQKAAEVKKLGGKIKEANQLYKQFETELRDLKAADATKYFPKGDEFKIALKEIQDNLAKHKSDVDRAELGLKKEEKTTEDIISDVKDTQNKTLESVDRSKKIIDETISVGGATLGQLQEDTHRMEVAIEKLDDIQDELGLAKKQMIAFARNMAKDKLIRAFLIIILLGALFVVIWANTSHEPAPGAPTTA